MPSSDTGFRWGWWLLGGIGAAALGFAIFHRKEAKEMIPNFFASKSDFARRIYNALDRNSKLGVIAKTILTAQAAHEAGWGVAASSRKGYNYWNLTAGSKWKGPTIEAKDTEYHDGVSKLITQRFRAYESDDEAARDMVRFIGPGTRYSKAWDILHNDSLTTSARLRDYVYALHEAGFFTQPPDQYLKGVIVQLQTVVSALG